MKPRRFSVIDIGTNSARFLAAEVAPDGSWRAVADRREPCRLGEGLSSGGMLGEAPRARAIAAVAAFVAAAEEVHAPIAKAVATYAVRKAANRDEFLAQLRERTGVTLEVIPPRVEGRLSYRAVTELAGAGGTPKLERIGVLDTGGGSVQLTVGIGCVAVASVSMPLGAVALTELFGGPEKSGDQKFEDLRDHIAGIVEDTFSRLPFKPRRIYGVGGGCTSAGVLAAQRAAGVLVPGGQLKALTPGAPMNVSAAEIREILRTIRPLSLAERAALPGLSVERSQIIVAGLAVTEAVLSRLGPHAMTTLDVGLRDGLVIEAAEGVQLRTSARAQSQRSLLPAASARLAARCRAPQPHSNQVVTLALGLHTELCRLAQAGELKRGRWCRPRSRAILQAAAQLHDAGTCISYKSHHKHIETIVRFNGLPGVKPRVTELVAAIARYHRRAMPSRKHDLFGSLEKKDRRLVRMLSAILRIADGLDRSHHQVVTAVKASVSDGVIALHAISTAEARAEITAATEKADLLGRVLGRAVTVARMAP